MTEEEKHHHHKLRLVINGTHHEWKEQYISGAHVRKLGNIPGEDKIFLAIVKPYEDEPVTDETMVDLARPGIEHFYSKEKHHEVTIIVNATPHEVKGPEITYSEVVTLAFPDFPQHPERTYTATYEKGPESNPSGILSPGGKVRVRNKMIFYVKHTGQS